MLGNPEKSNKNAYTRRNVPPPVETALISPEPADQPCEGIPTYEFLLSFKNLSAAAKDLVVADSEAQETPKMQSLRRDSDFWEVHKDSAAGQRLLDAYANFFDGHNSHPAEDLISKVYEPAPQPGARNNQLNEAVQSLVALQGMYDPTLLSHAVRLAFPGAPPAEDAEVVRRELDALKKVHLNLLKSYVEEKRANGEIINQLKSQVISLTGEYQTLKSELHEVQSRKDSDEAKTSVASSNRSHRSFAQAPRKQLMLASERDSEPQCQTIESVEIDCGLDSQSLPPGAKILETPRSVSNNVHLFAKHSIDRYNEALPAFQPPTEHSLNATSEQIQIVNETQRAIAQLAEDPVILATQRYTVSEPMEFGRVARHTYDSESTRLLNAQATELPAHAFQVENQNFSINPKQFVKDSLPAYHEETRVQNVNTVTWENHTPRASANLQTGPLEGTLAPRGTERRTKVIRISLNDEAPVTNVFNRPPGAFGGYANDPIVKSPVQYIHPSSVNPLQHVPVRYNPSAQFVNYDNGNSGFYSSNQVGAWQVAEPPVRRPSDLGHLQEGQPRWPNQPRHTFAGPIGYMTSPQHHYAPAPNRNGPVSVNVRVPNYMSHQRFGQAESHVVQVTRQEFGGSSNNTSHVTNINCLVPEPGIETSQRFSSRVSNF